MKFIVPVIILLFWNFAEAKEMKSHEREIKTYLSFGLPVDPVRIRTLTDLDLSYALASTLVQWDASRELVSGLANNWIVDGSQIDFHLRDLKWSNGVGLDSTAVIKSLFRAKKDHYDSLKSLFDLLTDISAPDPRTVRIKFKSGTLPSSVLNKLTEPMYGVLWINQNGTIDLSKTTGPFFLKKESVNELVMDQNLNWFSVKKDMPSSIIIRKPAKGEEVSKKYASDPWPNLISTSSMIPNEVSNLYKEQGYKAWSRNLDKVFFLIPSPKASLKESQSILKSLRNGLDRKTLTSGLTGYSLTDQFFPNGYAVYDAEFKLPSKELDTPSGFKNRPLKFLGIDVRIDHVFEQNIRLAVKKLTGIEPTFNLVTLDNAEKARVQGDYDIFAVSLPINDPNVEGAMSFIFSLNPPFIPDSGIGSKTLSDRVKAANHLPTEIGRLVEYRKIFTEATQAGSVLPLFHYSTVVLAKIGIDLSEIPNSDEAISFAKVRFR